MPKDMITNIKESNFVGLIFVWITKDTANARSIDLKCKI